MVDDLVDIIGNHAGKLNELLRYVPSGVIVETGKNANGRFIKFSDGTLICTSSTKVDLSVSGHTLALFPALFADNDIFVDGSFGTSADTAQRAAYKDFLVTQENWNRGWGLYVGSTSPKSLFVQLYAIGRWK